MTVLAQSPAGKTMCEQLAAQNSLFYVVSNPDGTAVCTATDPALGITVTVYDTFDNSVFDKGVCDGMQRAFDQPLSTPTPAVATGTLARPSDQAGSNTGVTVGGIKCQPAATVASYANGGVNAKFTIKMVFSDGKAYRPSSNLAVLAKCTYWLHTDDAGSVIFSAPAGTKLPNLGTLFSLWRTTNAQDPFVDMMASAFSGKLTADGVTVTNWQNHVIKDGELLVATAASTPPAPITIPGQ